MRMLLLATLVIGCDAAKPVADPLDEKMRHCPVAIVGATSTVEDIAGGVRITVTAPNSSEVRKRAHHVVAFAARTTRAGHGGADGSGGGRMKNCPVVTDGVTITATDLAGGARLDVIATDATHVDRLRATTRARAATFPFEGASLTVK